MCSAQSSWTILGGLHNIWANFGHQRIVKGGISFWIFTNLKPRYGRFLSPASQPVSKSVEAACHAICCLPRAGEG